MPAQPMQDLHCIAVLLLVLVLQVVVQAKTYIIPQQQHYTSKQTIKQCRQAFCLRLISRLQKCTESLSIGTSLACSPALIHI